MNNIHAGLEQRPSIAIIRVSENAWPKAAVSGLFSFFTPENDQILLPHLPYVDEYCVHEDIESVATLLRGLEQKKYTAIVTIGAWCSAHVAQWINRSGSTLTQFFCGVSNPEASFAGEVSGVQGISENHAMRAEAFTALYPNIDRIGLAYFPEKTGSIDCFEVDILPDVLKLKEALLERGLFVVDMPLLSKKSIGVQLPQAPAVCLFRDATRLPVLPDLVSHAERHDIVLYASDLGSVYRGVGMGFGDTGYEYGRETAKLVYQYLSEEKSIGELGIVQLNSPGTLSINNHCIGRQGMHFDEQTLRLIRAGVL